MYRSTVRVYIVLCLPALAKFVNLIMLLLQSCLANIGLVQMTDDQSLNTEAKKMKSQTFYTHFMISTLQDDLKVQLLLPEHVLRKIHHCTFSRKISQRPF